MDELNFTTPSGLTVDEIYGIMCSCMPDYNFVVVIKKIRDQSNCSLRDAKDSAEAVAVPLYKQGLVKRNSWNTTLDTIDFVVCDPMPTKPLTPHEIICKKIKSQKL